MSAVVFTGPTLPPEAAAALLPGAIILPPARQGDVFRAVQAHRPVAIGLIDGVFLHEPAVWHRELLWALSEAIHVFGAASMGALRAAELFSFGMRGVGRVFSAYRDGAWPGFSDPFEDDDEVAVVHAPAELGAAPLSDALVDLRDTLLAAEAATLLTREQRNALFSALKALPFPDRSFCALATLADTHLPQSPAEKLRAWLPTGKVPSKRHDAEALLFEVSAFLRTDPPPFTPTFRFERVKVWNDFASAEAPRQSAEEALVLEELRLHPEEWQEAARAALGRLLVAATEPTDAQTRGALNAFRTARGLARRADLDAWVADNAAAPAVFGRLMQGEAALHAAFAAPPPGLDTAIADHLRLTGRFAALLRRGRAKQAALASPALAATGPELDGALAWFAHRNHVALAVVRQDQALAAAVWREYLFQRGTV